MPLNRHQLIQHPNFPKDHHHYRQQLKNVEEACVIRTHSSSAYFVYYCTSRKVTGDPQSIFGDIYWKAGFSLKNSRFVLITPACYYLLSLNMIGGLGMN